MRLKDQSAQKFRRQMIVRLQSEGHVQAKIAELLDLTQSYVSRILRSYQQQGTSAFEVSTGKGAIAKLDDRQKEQLKVILDAGATAYGFEGELWTSKRVQRVIDEQFNVSYSQRQVDRILHQLDYTRQKPQRVDHRQSKEAQERWKTTELPALKKSRRGETKNRL